jgi:hypothetical protein
VVVAHIVVSVWLVVRVVAVDMTVKLVERVLAVKETQVELVRTHQVRMVLAVVAVLVAQAVTGQALMAATVVRHRHLPFRGHHKRIQAVAAVAQRQQQEQAVSLELMQVRVGLLAEVSMVVMV